MATLHVRLQNSTSAGMKSLRDDMQVTTDAAGDLSTTMAEGAQDTGSELQRLHDQHQQQIKVIHEHRASWSQLAATVLPVIDHATTAALKYAASLAEIAAKKKALETVLAHVAASQRTLNTLYGLGEKAAIRYGASLAGYGTTAARVGTAVGIATVALKGFEFWLAHTGKTAKESTEDFEKATKEQIEEFNKFAVASTQAGVDIETAMAAAGKTWEDFGARIVTEVETNLDRVHESAEKLGEDIKAFAMGGLDATKELGSEIARLAVKYDPTIHSLSVLLPIAMRKSEEAAGRLTFNLTEGMKRVGEAIRGVERDAIEAGRSLEDLQKRTQDDFARVRMSEGQAAAAARERADAARIAGLETTRAVDAEIQKLKDRRGLQAANDEFDDEAAKKYLERLNALESRRQQILDQQKRDEADARRKQLDEERKQSIEIQKLYSQAFEDRNAKIKKENEQAEKQAKEDLEARLKLIDQETQWTLRAEQRAVDAARKAADERDRIRRDEMKKAHDLFQKQVDDIAAMLGKGPESKNGPQGPSVVDQMRNSIKDRDIAKLIGQQRAEAAGREYDKTKTERRTELSDSGMLTENIQAKLRAERMRAQQQAFMKGFRDTITGKVNSDERAGAENQLVQANIQSAQKTGQLSDVVARGMSQAAQTAITADAKADKAIAMVNQVIKALQANGQRQRATNGSLK